MRALAEWAGRDYLVSSPINTYYYTQMIGDARTLPTLFASSNFTGLAVIGKYFGVHIGNSTSLFNDVSKMPTLTSLTVVARNGLSIKTTCMSNRAYDNYADDI